MTCMILISLCLIGSNIVTIGVEASVVGDGESQTISPEVNIDVAPYAWSLKEAFSDEFQGDALNLSKWQTFFPNWGGRAPGAFSSNNVVVNNDMLELRSAYDPSFDFPVGSDCCEYGNYTTSVVYGKQPVDFKGYIEVRAKVTKLRGLQSSVWLQGNSSEIGVFESNGDGSTVNSTHHCFDDDNSFGNSIAFTGRSDDEFHKYGVYFAPNDSVMFYFDDNKVGEAVEGNALCLDDRHHLIFDVEIVPFWTTLPEGNDFNASTATLLIDYVRSYALDDNCPSSHSGFFTAGTPGRLANQASYTVRVDNYDSADECAHECVKHGEECVAFEFRSDNGRCSLKHTGSLSAGLSATTSQAWKTYDRILLPCDDGTCWCHVVEDCTMVASQQFGSKIQKRILKNPTSNNLETPRRQNILTLGECFARCVAFGVDCKAIEYSPTLRKCTLKAQGGTGAALQWNKNYNFWNREDFCTSPTEVPDTTLSLSTTETEITSTVERTTTAAACASVSNAADAFDKKKKTKATGSWPWTRQQNLAACASECLALEATQCMRFGYNWKNKRCFLYGADPIAEASATSINLFTRTTEQCVEVVDSASLASAQGTGFEQKSTRQSSSRLAFVIGVSAIGSVLVALWVQKRQGEGVPAPRWVEEEETDTDVLLPATSTEYGAV